MAEQTKPSSNPPIVFDEIDVGMDLGSYEYTLTEDQFRYFRESVADPKGLFPTIAVKHDATSLNMKFQPGGGVNARQVMEFFSPPKPGMKIKVSGKLIDKYIRREKPYLVVQATAADEKGKLIERTTTYLMRKPEEVGKKWG